MSQGQYYRQAAAKCVACAGDVISAQETIATIGNTSITAKSASRFSPNRSRHAAANREAFHSSQWHRRRQTVAKRPSTGQKQRLTGLIKPPATNCAAPRFCTLLNFSSLCAANLSILLFGFSLSLINIRFIERCYHQFDINDILCACSMLSRQATPRT